MNTVVNEEAPHHEPDAPIADEALETQTGITSPIKARKSSLRAGRWFPEEERYAAKLVKEFKAGVLPLPEKITLREFLSLIFHCPPMRITKKFEGNNMIGKISYKRRGDMTPLGWWELKELERKFWERMVKSKSPSALDAHAKMVEYSAHIFQDAPDLSQFSITQDDNQEQEMQAQMHVNEINGMFLQLQHMFGPIVGTVDGAQQNSKHAVENVQTLEKMLGQSHKKHADLLVMSEIADLPADRKSLIDTARFSVKLEIEDIEAVLHEAKSVLHIFHQDELSKNFCMATGNMLTLQEMVYDSKHKLFLMEYKLSNLSTHLGVDCDSTRALSASIDFAKKDIEMLEYQLLKMKADINQKYRTE